MYTPPSIKALPKVNHQKKVLLKTFIIFRAVGNWLKEKFFGKARVLKQDVGWNFYFP